MKWLCDKDQEDFEQEKLIHEWIISQQQSDIEFDFKHINSKGNARNTLVRASFSLDQKISEDTKGTFADLIAGCDGRDLFSGADIDCDAATLIRIYLMELGINGGLQEWVIKTLLWSMNQKGWHSLTSETDSE